MSAPLPLDQQWTPKQISWIFFDFFGTLYKMSPTPIELGRRILKVLGGDPFVDCDLVIKIAAELDHAVYRLIAAGRATRLEDALQDPTIQSLQETLCEVTHLLPDKAIEFIQQWHEHWKVPGNQVQPFPGAPAVIQELSRRGFHLGVMSNTEWDLRPLLDRDGFEGFFSLLILSHRLGVQKPDARIFNEGSIKAQVPPNRCALVGDTMETDVEGARSAGWLPVFLHHGAKLPKQLEGVVIVSQLEHLLRYFIASSDR